MQKRSALVSSAAILAAVTCSTALAADWVHPARAPSQAAASDVCVAFSNLSGDYTVSPGSTGGDYGAPQAGERFTVTFSGSGSGSFRMVGDPGGTVTLSGPTNAPGTLTYIAGGSPVSGAVGVGFYFDSGSGSLTLQASCTFTTHPAPALGARGLALLGALLALAGMATSRRSRRRENRS
jgi:hypothetical protein